MRRRAAAALSGRIAFDGKVITPLTQGGGDFDRVKEDDENGD